MVESSVLERKKDRMGQFKLLSSTEAKRTRFSEAPIFQEGLYRLREGAYAWMVPNGSWGESNAGLIVGEGESLLVDSLMDNHITKVMLERMEPLTAANPLTKAVITHADPDHFWGLSLVNNCEIITSQACAEALPNLLPRSMKLLGAIGNIFRFIPLFNLHRIGHWLKTMGAPYNYDGFQLVQPQRTFSGEMKIDVGGREVTLIETGPGHSESDVMVYLPQEKVLYTGDILFIGVTPVMWEGPVENWINCLYKILKMDLELIVPGHGPVTDKNGVRGVINYLEYVNNELVKAYKKGMPLKSAVHDIIEDRNFKKHNFHKLNSPERIIATAHTIYRHLKGGPKPTVMETVKIMMAQGELAYSFPDSQPQIMRGR